MRASEVRAHVWNELDQEDSEAFNLSELWTCVHAAPSCCGWLLSSGRGRLSAVLCDLGPHSSLVFPFIPDRGVQDHIHPSHSVDAVLGWVWWYMLESLALGRQRQGDHSEFEVTSACLVSSRLLGVI